MRTGVLSEHSWRHSPSGVNPEGEQVSTAPRQWSHWLASSQKKSDKTEGGQHTWHCAGHERHTWAQLSSCERSVRHGDTAQRVVKGLGRIKHSRNRRGAEPSSTRREKGSGEGARPRIIQPRSVQVGHGLNAPIGGWTTAQLCRCGDSPSGVRDRLGRLEKRAWSGLGVARTHRQGVGRGATARHVGKSRGDAGSDPGVSSDSNRSSRFGRSRLVRCPARALSRAPGQSKDRGEEPRHNTRIDPGVLSDSNRSSWFGSGHAVASKPRPRWCGVLACTNREEGLRESPSIVDTLGQVVLTRSDGSTRWIVSSSHTSGVALRPRMAGSGRTGQAAVRPAIERLNGRVGTWHGPSTRNDGVGRELDVLGRNDDARSILAWSRVVWVNGRDEGGPERCQRARQVVEARSSLSTRRFVSRSMASGSYTNPSETGTGPERHWGARAVREARSEGSTCRVVKATPGRSWRRFGSSRSTGESRELEGSLASGGVSSGSPVVVVKSRLSRLAPRPSDGPKASGDTATNGTAGAVRLRGTVGEQEGSQSVARALGRLMGHRARALGAGSTCRVVGTTPGLSWHGLGLSVSMGRSREVEGAIVYGAPRLELGRKSVGDAETAPADASPRLQAIADKSGGYARVARAYPSVSHGHDCIEYEYPEINGTEAGSTGLLKRGVNGADCVEDLVPGNRGVGAEMAHSHSQPLPRWASACTRGVRRGPIPGTTGPG
ncbi:hypothetical protein BDV93DRAFT_511600 [Ceratobasidium sp. AG-I]|nr:hypothetical protein BDV93DRAFT_511600 [Ceratobasidium sp. AG-I]